MFLEQLAEYADTAGSVLKRNDVETDSMMRQPDNVHRLPLGVYISE